MDVCVGALPNSKLKKTISTPFDDDESGDSKINIVKLTLQWRRSISVGEVELHEDFVFGKEFPTIHHWIENKI